ncbi:exostosin-2 [Anopheles sinensis]|uniref:Exostosin-2 n=1 Tax=Anopheles sinensis TaxID=74873 RepID=A0A084VJ36_ANOSI|nr:exostosin-2 [Anopheles sinensis]
MTLPVKYSAIKPPPPSPMKLLDVNRYVIGFVVALVLLALWFGGGSGAGGEADGERLSLDLADIPQVVLDKEAELARARNRNCSYWDCFNVYRCGGQRSVAGGGGMDGSQERISIYVYPLKEYVDADSKRAAFQLSKEFHTILKTIVNSPYYTSNPNEACLFMPTLDTLNQNRIDTTLVGKALASLP